MRSTTRLTTGRTRMAWLKRSQIGQLGILPWPPTRTARDLALHSRGLRLFPSSLVFPSPSYNGCSSSPNARSNPSHNGSNSNGMAKTFSDWSGRPPTRIARDLPLDSRDLREDAAIHHSPLTYRCVCTNRCHRASVPLSHLMRLASLTTNRQASISPVS
ncbi:hypothetical protein M378DRAFT_652015 [Amanita muscaria Koide BX008]|uniref:Uncharacterized protein n=1 Tax=Amanita muscaria (strain Koide BX008) TaxID=946122 RepID=A0A0C2WG79_AMAMK|nr:hypothetical protein M378DRAFT_652015 [Amanita muscaria Koide BX008]